MMILAYETTPIDGRVILKESTGESVASEKLEDLFTFLVNDYGDCLKVAWNLDSTVSLFIKLLGPSKAARLYRTHYADVPPFSVFHVPGKVFGITHVPSKQKANLYSLDQYFPDYAPPEDLEETQIRGRILATALTEMGLEPTKLTSPVTLYDECVMSKMNVPKLKDLPLPAATLPYYCAARPWIESHVIGYFSEVWDYDLRSAYPMVTKDLIDTRDCWWKPGKEYEKRAIYGYAKCKITIHDDVVVSPIIQETEEGLSRPVGTWEGYLTKGDMDFMTKWGIGGYEILDGIWCIPVNGRTLRKPFYKAMNTLLEYKQKTGVLRTIAKRASVGIGGKFGEDRMDKEDEFGPYFFPPYFAEVTTQPRLQVAEFLYSRGIGPKKSRKSDKLLHLGVDGIMLTSPLDDIDGNWRLEYQGPALILSSGLVYTNITRPKGLTLPQVLEMINEDPESCYYSKILKRRLTLGDSVSLERPDDIGEELEFRVSLNLIYPQHDRVFSRLPQNGGQLLKNKYHSKPRKVK